jgi:hypothetical protein
MGRNYISGLSLFPCFTGNRLIPMFISIVPAIESRRLLMGETVDKKTLKEIVQITEQNTSVKSDTSFFYVHVA